MKWHPESVLKLVRAGGRAQDIISALQRQEAKEAEARAQARVLGLGLYAGTRQRTPQSASDLGF